MKAFLREIGKLFDKGTQKTDKLFYGVVKDKITTNDNVTGYKVSLGGDSGTIDARKFAGAEVGDTVMLCKLANGSMIVLGRKDGDKDALDAQDTAEEAYIVAEDAEDTAEDAINAVDVVQSHFWTDNNGVHITPNESSVSGENVLINSNGMILANGDPTVSGNRIAEFGKNSINIGILDSINESRISLLNKEFYMRAYNDVSYGRSMLIRPSSKNNSQQICIALGDTMTGRYSGDYERLTVFRTNNGTYKGVYADVQNEVGGDNANMVIAYSNGIVTAEIGIRNGGGKYLSGLHDGFSPDDIGRCIRLHCGSTNFIIKDNNSAGLYTENSSSFFTEQIRFGHTGIITANGLKKFGIPRTGNTYDATWYDLGDGTYAIRRSSSARKFKKNIKDLTDEITNPERLYELHPRQFVWKKEVGLGDDLNVGFIADEIEKVYPPATRYDTDENGEKFACDWDVRAIVPAMLKLIQDQKKEIDELKARVDSLENRNE